MSSKLIIVTIEGDRENFKKIVEVLKKDFDVTKIDGNILTLSPKDPATKAKIWFDFEGCPRV